MTDESSRPIAFVTLCMYHDTASPDVISSTLETSPTKKLRKGEIGVAGYEVPQNEWFFSRDIERSIAQAIQSLLDNPLRYHSGVKSLIESGWEIIISIALDHRIELDDALMSAEQMALLSDMNISCKLRVA